MHIQTVDQLKAIKTIKGKISDIGKMKVEEQRKAVRSGYDPDILPPDLITFSKDAAELLADLQSRNERMFLLTFTVVNLAPTRQRLENDVFTVGGIAQKYNCALKRLDWQQEQGFVSSLALGYNEVEIQRGMTTSSTAIFIPFMTRELRMDGQALYYGMNALSHNVIMADRKKLKSANGMYLGSTGSGKSFAAKRELLNVFLTIPQDRIIIVDPMGEYAPLVRRLGGQVVERQEFPLPLGPDGRAMSDLAVAGALIGVMTTNPVIAAIGTCLGRGTVISIVLVMAVLPQILLIGDTIVERTSFDVKVPVDLSRVNRTASGNMRVSGRVRGYVNGVIDAEIKGTLNGTLKASVTSGTTIEPTKPDFYLPESKEQAAAEWAENYTEGEEV
mgnify:CR=1 FL=1